MAVEVKICGLMAAEAVAAAAAGGARFVGFVFYPPSPRSLDPAAAGPLVDTAPADVVRVGLFVDADDADIADVLAHVRLDMLQFHGREPPERVAAIKERFGLPVMKAVPVAGEADIERARGYEVVADRLLFDAQAPPGATRPGGNALAFDWALISGVTWRRPWMLAGGLDAANVSEAVRVSGAAAVDVSSGVEDAPGVKNLDKIRDFLETARAL